MASIYLIEVSCAEDGVTLMTVLDEDEVGAVRRLAWATETARELFEGQGVMPWIKVTPMENAQPDDLATYRSIAIVSGTSVAKWQGYPPGKPSE